ncbi:putative PurR-regulated permease PerM [Bradyrhizobium japonicum]|uniref:PurR-regulated permease PerM n=1 Tax=Bradyrhizobium elkanii TaxID=29448 RepID=A0ABV4F1W6_BRAEL|nr:MULTISPECIES: AI-2E family transporter [Bradyrhizobium]MCP1731497.1 putative PurR-regulated permease PerM [Bradyrhizobium elkanii]MCP1758446.1 putative PurR-regulated permease PerM [Bradyrhizobium elkanii]MCP1932021.1 putative PurR-regulated permease PerM [Bradyrhizobium elkanii]MCP1983762.1 putative PurR-regulated permease PerM [Bradyrhizobium elkanii]MCS3479860.1 putative PurR-regulated permease PerM [Bradyrhizobium elkanii]
MTDSADHRLQARNDLAWAIAVGGIGVVLFAALLTFAWHFAATLFLLFAGMLLGVALNAMTTLLGRLTKLPHALRLAIVCLAMAGLLSGIVFLGGTTIAQQATVLSNTIKSQLGSVKDFLEQHGVDTSYLDFTNAAGEAKGEGTAVTTTTTPPSSQSHGIPGAGALASSGGAIISQTLKVLLGTVSVVGNFFIVLFLGLAFAAQPSIYRAGLLFIAPAKYRAQATIIVDRIGETLERWLIAQIITMTAVFLVTWIGLAIIGIPSSFILGIQAGLLAFIPTVGAILGGLIVVLASLATGWIAALSAFILFLGVHALESYVLTPIIQRQALDIPPATLFAFQILLGVVFGIWGLALALPLMAIAKVMIDHFKTEEPARAA